MQKTCYLCYSGTWRVLNCRKTTREVCNYAQIIFCFPLESIGSCFNSKDIISVWSIKLEEKIISRTENAKGSWRGYRYTWHAKIFQWKLMQINICSGLKCHIDSKSHSNLMKQKWIIFSVSLMKSAKNSIQAY